MGLLAFQWTGESTTECTVVMARLTSTNTRRTNDDDGQIQQQQQQQER